MSAELPDAEIPLQVRFGRDGSPQPVAPEDCEPHTPCPAGYLAWHEWAEQMERTHDQRQCKGCGLLAIWEPKHAPAAVAGSDPAEPELEALRDGYSTGYAAGQAQAPVHEPVSACGVPRCGIIGSHQHTIYAPVTAVDLPPMAGRDPAGSEPA